MPEPYGRTYSLIVVDVRELEVVQAWPLASGNGGAGVELQLGEYQNPNGRTPCATSSP